MAASFERGTEGQPKGHALLYFTGSAEPDEVWATYLVILPVSVDVAKYVPPFLMNQVGDIGPKDLSAFAFPPAPEKMPGRASIERLAEVREDDILYGGTINSADVTGSMMAVSEAVQKYVELYEAYVGPTAAGAETAELEAPDEEGLSVNDVMYGLMSDSDKLSELTKLVGRLRFAIDGTDAGLVKETEQDIRVLSKHLPDDNRIPSLIEAVKTTDERGPGLADLYLKRCFFLIQQEFTQLGQVEEEIRSLEAGEGR